MTNEIGWAEPTASYGEPRVHKVKGFSYLYTEKQFVRDVEVGDYRDDLVRKVEAAYESLYGNAPKPSLLVMFINVPDQDGMYHMQTGFVVAPGTLPVGDALVREIPPAKVASIVTCCDSHSIWKSYAPLMDFMNNTGLQPLEEGWREYFLYYEGPDSMNNITWVQHLAGE